MPTHSNRHEHYVSCEVISSSSGNVNGRSWKGVKIAFVNRSVPLLWANLFFATVLLSAEVGHKVVLPLWVDSANGTVTGATMNPYFALSFSSIAFFILFGLGTMFIRIFWPGDIGETEKRFPRLLLFFSWKLWCPEWRAYCFCKQRIEDTALSSGNSGKLSYSTDCFI